MALTEMITLDELLRDPSYREYFAKVPKLPEHYKGTLPWKLYILKKDESTFRSKKFATYKEAFEGYKKMKPLIQNAAINCPALGFIPPVRTVKVKGKLDAKNKPILVTKVWKPRIEADMDQHYWCSHCRRPTVWRIASLNLNRKGSSYTLPLAEPTQRCVICGASERVVDLRDPLNAQQWDINRPFIAPRVI